MHGLLSISGGALYYVLLYAVGIVALTLSVIAFQFKHRVTIIIFSLLGQSCWVLYFLIQSDFASAVACGLSAVMLAIFSLKDKWKWATSKFCVIFFCVLICGFSLLTFSVWSDVFPLLAGFFAVIANSRSTEKRLRQFALLWCSFWLFNSIIKVYPVALLNDLLCTVSAAVSLYRYRKIEKSESAPNINQK